jgi:hypothetical protein
MATRWDPARRAWVPAAAHGRSPASVRPVKTRGQIRRDCCVLWGFLSIGLVGAFLPTVRQAFECSPRCANSSDFRSLGVACNVTGLKHCWGQLSVGRRYYCSDVYTYTFNVMNKSNLSLSYQTRRETIRRGEGRCDTNFGSPYRTSATYTYYNGDGTQTTEGNGCLHWGSDSHPPGRLHGQFIPGQVYQCWAPIDGRTNSTLPSAYQCGSSACVKMFHPTTDFRSDVYSDGVLLVIAFMVSVVASFLILLAVELLLFRCWLWTFFCYPLYRTIVRRPLSQEILLNPNPRGGTAPTNAEAEDEIMRALAAEVRCQYGQAAHVHASLAFLPRANQPPRSATEISSLFSHRAPHLRCLTVRHVCASRDAQGYTPDQVADARYVHDDLNARAEHLRKRVTPAARSAAQQGPGCPSLPHPGSAASHGIGIGSSSSAPVVQANVVQANVVQANVVQANVVQADVVQANVVQANVVQANVVQANVVRAVPVSAGTTAPMGTAVQETDVSGGGVPMGTAVQETDVSGGGVPFADAPPAYGQQRPSVWQAEPVAYTSNV